MKNEAQIRAFALLDYLYHRTDEKHPASVQDILRYWELTGINASRKSVYSDIDLLILVDGNKLTVKEEDRIITPLYDIEIETGVQINARVLLKKIWENRPFQTPFGMNVMKEGIVL